MTFETWRKFLVFLVYPFFSFVRPFHPSFVCPVLFFFLLFPAVIDSQWGRPKGEENLKKERIFFSVFPTVFLSQVRQTSGRKSMDPSEFTLLSSANPIPYSFNLNTLPITTLPPPPYSLESLQHSSLPPPNSSHYLHRLIWLNLPDALLQTLLSVAQYPVPGINELDHRGHSPLTLAVSLNRISCVFLLISNPDFGCSISVKSRPGWTPYQEATALGNRDLMKALLKHRLESLTANVKSKVRF